MAIINKKTKTEMLIRINLKRVPKFKPINARSKEVSRGEHHYYYYLFTAFPCSTTSTSKTYDNETLKRVFEYYLLFKEL